MTIDLKALKDALAKAAPGPLTFVDRGEALLVGSPTYEVLEIEFDDTEYYPSVPQKKDAKAMVMAFNSAPAMIATIQAQAERVRVLEDALRDMHSGWRYIRQHHGDLPGVGWERCDNAARAALGDKS